MDFRFAAEQQAGGHSRRVTAEKVSHQNTGSVEMETYRDGGVQGYDAGII